jgi:hypothetical protein
MAEVTRNGSIPISTRRMGVLAASLVWRVARTMWPVRAASIEIMAVSLSRISPTRTMSGSERRIDRRAAAKLSPALTLSCTWLMPFRRSSTGSSTVMMFFSGELSAARVAYSVVVLPDPVGPVTRMVPYGLV